MREPFLLMCIQRGRNDRMTTHRRLWCVLELEEDRNLTSADFLCHLRTFKRLYVL